MVLNHKIDENNVRIDIYTIISISLFIDFYEIVLLSIFLFCFLCLASIRFDSSRKPLGIARVGFLQVEYHS